MIEGQTDKSKKQKYLKIERHVSKSMKENTLQCSVYVPFTAGMWQCHYFHRSDKDITTRISWHTHPSHSVQYISTVLTPLGSSDQIPFQCRGERVGDSTLARNGQMKVCKHAFVAGSASPAQKEMPLISRVNHCNQNSLWQHCTRESILSASTV